MTGRLRVRWERLRYQRLLRRLAGPRLLRAFARRYPEAFFVEIGANDGEQHDHLRPHILSSAWSGIMVEPVPYVFERLRGNYRHLDRVALENVAIGARDGVLPFYHLREPAPDERERLPDWYDGVGSFSRETVTGHARDIPDVERRVVRAEVPVLTFESLCRRHDVKRVDLLVIDTEGYDHEILKSIELERRHPRLAVYEHYHLPAAEREACRELMRDAGYETMEEGFDTFCLDAREGDVLSHEWRRLRPAVPGAYVEDERPAALSSEARGTAPRTPPRTAR
jgi:FkbM family methyltransferase